MLRLLEHILLGKGVSDLVLSYDDFLLQDLHGVQVVGGLFTAQDDLAKGTLAQDLDELKVFKRDLLLAGSVLFLATSLKHVGEMIIARLVGFHTFFVEFGLDPLNSLDPILSGNGMEMSI